MKNKRGVISISANHIEAGIAKYKGVQDETISKLIKFSGLEYTPYLFNDGRVLLVLPNNIAAFLYDDKEALFDALSLEP